jgi:hypothetical protein
VCELQFGWVVGSQSTVRESESIIVLLKTLLFLTEGIQWLLWLDQHRFFFSLFTVFHFKVSFGDLGAKSCSHLCIFINYWIENLFYEKVNNRKSWMINNLMSRY